MVTIDRVWLKLQLENKCPEDWFVKEVDREGDFAKPLAHAPSGGGGDGVGGCGYYISDGCGGGGGDIGGDDTGISVFFCIVGGCGIGGGRCGGI